ncbi:MAG: hypothetical protein GX257_04600, partial [Clostridiales bacterium]|nr:hypothetical protein [Clostridiales bacterium]
GVNGQDGVCGLTKVNKLPLPVGPPGPPGGDRWEGENKNMEPANIPFGRIGIKQKGKSICPITTVGMNISKPGQE